MRDRSVIRFDNSISYHFSEIYEYRFVFFNMVRRNLEGRYRNTILGLAWHFIVPMLTILLYYVVFTQIKSRPIDDFALYLSIAVFPLNFLSGCIHGRALLSNRKFITKMYFPRELAVLSDAISNYVTFVIIYGAVMILTAFFRPSIDVLAILFLPIVMVLLFIFGFGCSLIFSTITVIYTDFVHLFNPLISLLIWITPTFFLISDVSGTLAKIVWFNPLTYFVESFHSILYFGIMPSLNLILATVGLAAGFILIGLLVFFKYEDRIPEVL